MVAITLTGLGWAVFPFIVIVIAALIFIPLIWARRQRVSGFDVGEAANYIWSGLDRNQRQRIAMAHVVAMIEAERVVEESAFDTGFDDEDLKSFMAEAAIDAGAVLYERDVDDLLRLQYAYAEAKGVV